MKPLKEHFQEAGWEMRNVKLYYAIGGALCTLAKSSLVHKSSPLV